MEIRFAPNMPARRPLLILNAGYEAIRASEHNCWPFHQIVCCSHGKGSVVVFGQQHSLQTGNVFLIKPNTPHEYVMEDAPFYLSWVSFVGYLAEGLPTDYGVSTEERLRITVDHEHPNIHLKIMSILEQVTDPFTVDRLVSVLFDIFIDYLLLCQSSSSGHMHHQKRTDTISKAVEWIKNHIYEPVDIARFASEMDMSRQHLARLFRLKFGTTPRDFYVRLKIQQAQQDLAEYPDITVQSIANKLGFINASHFTRVFHQISGTTPLEFRRTFLLDKNSY